MHAARLILLIVAGRYLLSAALLAAMRARGGDVPVWWPVGWAICGIVGAAATFNLAPERPWAWWLALAALGPWMLLSLVMDARHGIWPMVLLDAAGVAAIAYALWLAR